MVFNMHEGVMPIRYSSSCYKEKSVQVRSFTYSTSMFLVLKACLRDVVFFAL